MSDGYHLISQYDIDMSDHIQYNIDMILRDV